MALPSPPHSSDELRALCRLRSTLETFALGMAKERADWPAAREALGRRLEELQTRARHGGHEAFHRADMDLHRALVAAAGMPVLLENWERVVQETDAWILRVKQVYWPSLMALYREHVLLLEAWDAPGTTVAEHATREHLEAGWHRMDAMEGKSPADAGPVERAASFISTHYAGRLDVPWIAANVSFVSASQLTRLFHKEKGLPPRAWIRQVRLEHAAQQLRSTTEDIAAVARQSGYRNVSHFVRDFRVHFGITPRRYREKEDAG
ncbi:hypothetical protein DB346_20055 [Verrucomicrobia bacterium LW23]|nr:hypothetical protein DB346_20055 [Verrucomicrobia bacterium LW23]